MFSTTWPTVSPSLRSVPLSARRARTVGRKRVTAIRPRQEMWCEGDANRESTAMRLRCDELGLERGEALVHELERAIEIRAARGEGKAQISFSRLAERGAGEQRDAVLEKELRRELCGGD